MKFTAIILLMACLSASASGYSQRINISVKEVSLDKVFMQIEKQSGYLFFYTKEQLTKADKVTIDLKNASLEEVLAKCFKGQPFSYEIINKTIVVSPKEEKKSQGYTIPGINPGDILPPPTKDISGKVTDAEGNPLVGASIKVRGGTLGTSTNADGVFILKGVDEKAVIEIGFVGYETMTLSVGGRSSFVVSLKVRESTLQEVIVNKGYYTEKQRNTVGNVTTITAKDIEKQPVQNPLAALAGRVPGLVITQTNGIPGSSFKVQLRGQASIGVLPANLPPNDPLFIINGVPLAGNNNAVGNIPSALAKGLSPLNTINIADIESIEVLKDADATAIYGSRGANGVILITTKKGKSGKMRLNINVRTGVSKIVNTSELLNTEQYVAMRKEALANDGIIATAANAPDLISWDTTRYTNWKKYFIGGTAHVVDAQTSLSGGDAYNQFLLSASYYRETTVFPGDLPNSRASFNFNTTHRSVDQKFKADLSAFYSVNANKTTGSDMTQQIRLSPNFPSLYDEEGKLKWVENNVNFLNPIAPIYQIYTSNSNNLISNLNLSYEVLKGLLLRTSFGYNVLQQKDNGITPIYSQIPIINPLGSSRFSNDQRQSWIIEPQIEHNTRISKGKLTVLAGATFQKTKSELTTTMASGYNNDVLLRSLGAATTVTSTNNNTQYNYTAIFGRINYNWEEKYLLNLTGRRDGSSRFGRGKQFGNFGALGAAWIFSNEPLFKEHVRFLSFGKIRGSYGTTGQDQIGDYGYLNLWNPLNVTTQYQGIPGLIPTRLFNPDFAWEVTRKLEVAIDLGWLDNRILLSAAYFRNRTGNQLISYRLPVQTGFGSIPNVNFPALVENSGVELVLNTKPVQSKSFSWTSVLSLTVPRNKLVSFPNLATSSYSGSLIEGKSLSVGKAYIFLGVDPATGLFKVDDLTEDGIINSKDYDIVGNRDPKYYGGFSNTFTYKNLQLDVFFEGRKQVGTSHLFSLYSSTRPGNLTAFTFYGNVPVTVLDRWQKPGDITDVQRFSTSTSAAASSAINNFLISNATITDASFIRLKTLSLSYNLPVNLLKKMAISNLRIYVSGQNLFTITDYEGSDPETQNPLALPPLRTYTAGIQLTF